MGSNVNSDSSEHLYASMYRIRRFEEEVFEFYKRGLMPGLAHLYIGEEAIAVGACEAIRQDDFISSTHRGHGHLLARGAEPKLMMAEILGKQTGYCHGKGGSMHIMDMKRGILGANGIVGGGIPIATGAAYSCRFRGTDQVVLCFFGDGASNEGTFHESVNMAAAWDLPVIYIIENNLYGITVSVDRVTKEHDLARRAIGYGIDGYTIDGNDVEIVRDTVAHAVAKARKGEGPSIVECKTYRQHGHNGSDNGAYRKPGELEYWKSRDPLKIFKEKQLLSEKQIADIERSVDQEIAEACRFAEESPSPDESELMRGIFYEG